MEITTHGGSGDEQRFTVAYSRTADDPSGALTAMASSGGLGRLLHEVGNGESVDHLPESAAEMEEALHLVRDVLAGLETRRRLLMSAAREHFRGDFPLRDLAEHAGLSTMTARRRLEEDRGRWPGLRAEPDNEVRVILTVGDQAELVTSRHPASAPLRVPVARIAEQAGLAAEDLPGRRFTVERLTAADADGFVLAENPRF
ncbi:hypothetical protein [Nonomuraea aridisoli]|uniref:hypothetical protein n=1 Tax=Nonomuraea aridisoli TaxID=2070368 RepID=UPI001C647D09|nr:hypothetical protein [Nonomuraea aridisoli]